MSFKHGKAADDTILPDKTAGERRSDHFFSELQAAAGARGAWLVGYGGALRLHTAKSSSRVCFPSNKPRSAFVLIILKRAIHFSNTEEAKFEAVADSASSAPLHSAGSPPPATLSLEQTEVRDTMPARTKVAAVKTETASKRTTKTKAAAASSKATKPAGKMTDLTNGAASRKRKVDDEVKEEQPAAAVRPAKKTKTAAAKPTTKHVAIGPQINEAPTKVLDVFVFGEGSSGELGLGSKRVNGKKPIDVKRPRLNDNLSATSVGVVDIACGGMHVAALTKKNEILTWGVNDQGALGRDTTWDGGLRDMDKEDESDSEDEDDSGVNPMESTPMPVDVANFAPKTKFVQVVASDSATFALTEDGRVYGWGTFRSNDGILGFCEGIEVRNTPMMLPGLKNIKALAAGSNHILALDHKGSVVAWGCGQQNQLGRRIIERNKLSSLIPQGVGLPRGKIVKIACGSYHSFAIDKDGHVWGWGLNNFGEIGVQSNAGEDDAAILKPVKLTHLADHSITDIDGGEHHSLACSSEGKLFTWGRVDGYQVGIELDKFAGMDNEEVIFDERGSARILVKPTALAGK